MRRIDKKNIKLTKDEAGYALMWVLVVIILAAIILVPLLLLMTAGLTSSHHHEERMLRFYAADAGIEDAIWKMDNGQLPTSPYYLSEPVNGMQVLVTPDPGDTMQGFFAGLLEIPGGGILHKAAPASDWMVTYAFLDQNTYVIEVVYQPVGGTPATKKIDGMGAWLFGSYDYVEGTAHGVTDAYPIYAFSTKRYGGGSAFIWEWTAAARPVARVGVTLTLTFDFTPEGNPQPNVGWVDAGSDNIFISWSGVVAMGDIVAEATDPTSGKSTKVTSLLVVQDVGASILVYTYEGY